MSDRFKLSGRTPMRVINKGNFLAAFNVVDLDLGIEFRDVRLIQGSNGVFIGPPFRTYDDKDGKKQYVDLWRPAYDEDLKARDENGVAYVEEMAEFAFEHYQALMQQAESTKAARRDARSESGNRRSGRGPVARKSAAPTTTKAETKPAQPEDFEEFPGALEDEDDDLPF